MPLCWTHDMSLYRETNKRPTYLATWLYTWVIDPQRCRTRDGVQYLSHRTYLQYVHILSAVTKQGFMNLDCRCHWETELDLYSIGNDIVSAASPIRWNTQAHGDHLYLRGWSNVKVFADRFVNIYGCIFGGNKPRLSFSTIIPLWQKRLLCISKSRRTCWP